ncbi:hypothetical protein CY652_15515 [Burkholderia sp. WAC0059]|uniref:hypothetical protein n=1 Tax=Burkholderia sp. WAC0059 TaxID=2066022 RepID=UPI000C7E8C46|nr:hypothetical protein [Burkholderia sp. WAC0059]PLZ01520.1 hypothetical protein CY652_15515 [Burkholderia sp. WAC0059]
MGRNERLKRIRRNGSGLVEQFLPTGARDELADVIRDRRPEIDTASFPMFLSIRVLLREYGMANCEPDREAR